MFRNLIIAGLGLALGLRLPVAFVIYAYFEAITYSFQFMSSSLDRLVSNLPNEALQYTSEKFKGRKVNLMAKKGKPNSSIC